jgi:hypothetical protein
LKFRLFEILKIKVLTYEDPSEAEVGDLNLALIVNQDVGGLDIPMDDVLAVHEVQGAQRVVNQCCDMGIRKVVCCQKLLKIEWQVIHYEKHVVKVIIWQDHFDQFHCENVIRALRQVLEYRNFSKHLTSHIGVSVHIANQFYGYISLFFSVLCLEDLPECAMAKQFDHLVFFLYIFPQRALLCLVFHWN